MLRNIKEKIKNVPYDFIYSLEQLIMFFIDIVLHPIRNISCIFIVVLYVLLEKANIDKLSGKRYVSFFGRDGYCIDIYCIIFTKCDSRSK